MLMMPHATTELIAASSEAEEEVAVGGDAGGSLGRVTAP
jgi:hypothetical protein